MAKKTISTVKSKKETPVRLEHFIDKVKAKAFEIYLERERNGIPGDEIGDWIQAEAQVKMALDIK